MGVITWPRYYWSSPSLSSRRMAGLSSLVHAAAKWPAACGKGGSSSSLWKADEPLRSARATTQPNRQDTLYWATGLTPVYLDGALKRTLRPAVKPVVTDRAAVPFFDGPAGDEPPRANGVSVLNPFSVYRKGEHVLRSQLGALSAWHLVNIINTYALSEDSLVALNATPSDVLTEIIVDGVRRSAATER